MDKPKEIWIFSKFTPEVIGPCEIIGESADGSCWRYKRIGHAHIVCFIHKDRVISTRRQAAKDCYEYHDEDIRQRQENLDRKKRLLGEFYLEELYEKT